MQKDSNSELLKDDFIPFHNHQARIQTSVPILWELVKSEMEVKREETSYKNFSSDERESKKVLDSGFQTVDSGFKVLDSGFQSVVGLWILELNSAFQFSKSRIPDCARKKSWIPNFSSKKIHELRNPDSFLGAKL